VDYSSRIADGAVMVRPRDFGFNEETAGDNEFQVRLGDSPAEINRKANAEFQNMVDRLRAEGIDIMVLEPGEAGGVRVPDAVFPNNWFLTERDGTIVTFPMMAPNRRAEVRPLDLERLLVRSGRVVANHIHVGRWEEDRRFLEGTGALVIDRALGTVYAACSHRCDQEQFNNFVRLRSFKEGVLFHSAGSSGKPIYHTNVLMNLGEKYAVVCAEAIADVGERQRVLESLRRGFEVIEIGREQMEKHYCGNILQLRNRDGETPIVMSARACDGFTAEQRRRLAGYGKIVSVELDVIETIGGGSARCMLAEIFSPRI
jgi:hypothetical protein